MQVDLTVTYRWEGKNYGPGMTEIPDSLAAAIGLNVPPPIEEPPPPAIEAVALAEKLGCSSASPNIFQDGEVPSPKHLQQESVEDLAKNPPTEETPQTHSKRKSS